METFFRSHTKNRAYLCKCYDIQITQRYQVIRGQKVEGIYGKVTTIVYEFIAQNKKFAANKPFFFLTGAGAGRDFVRLLNIEHQPPVFNLVDFLLQDPVINYGQDQQAIPNGNQHLQARRARLIPINREIINILCIFFYWYRLDVELPTFKIYKDIIENPEEFQPNHLKSMNTIFYNSFNKLTLTALLDLVEKRLRENEQNMANFQFNHLIRYFQEHPDLELQFFGFN